MCSGHWLGLDAKASSSCFFFESHLRFNVFENHNRSPTQFWAMRFAALYPLYFPRAMTLTFTRVSMHTFCRTALFEKSSPLNAIRVFLSRIILLQQFGCNAEQNWTWSINIICGTSSVTQGSLSPMFSNNDKCLEPVNFRAIGTFNTDFQLLWFRFIYYPQGAGYSQSCPYQQHNWEKNGNKLR